MQWHIQIFFGKNVFSRRFQSKTPKGHNCELWRIIFSWKYLWMAWVGVRYYGKCNYYVLFNCIRHCVRREFIQNYFKVFSFLFIWDKNLGSHASWPVAKPLWIHPCYDQYTRVFHEKWNLIAKNCYIWYHWKGKLVLI